MLRGWEGEWRLKGEGWEGNWRLKSWGWEGGVRCECYIRTYVRTLCVVRHVYTYVHYLRWFCEKDRHWLSWNCLFSKLLVTGL